MFIKRKHEEEVITCIPSMFLISNDPSDSDILRGGLEICLGLVGFLVKIKARLTAILVMRPMWHCKANDFFLT